MTDNVQRVKMGHRTKLHGNRSKLFWDIAVYWFFFKRAAVRHLRFALREFGSPIGGLS